MKLLFKFLIILAVAGGIFTSCIDEVTYSDQLKDEKELISDFFSRNNISIVETAPATIPYPANVYYKTPTGLYIQITAAGDTTTDSLEVNDEITIRYKKYTLEAKADTSYYLNTQDNREPVAYNYYDFSQTQSCKGWHEAVSLMKYTNAQAKIIVYSKLGFSSDQESVTPYGYDIYIKIRK